MRRNHILIRFVTRSTVTGRVLKVHAGGPFVERGTHEEARRHARLFFEGFGRETGSWKTTREAQILIGGEWHHFPLTKHPFGDPPPLGTASHTVADAERHHEDVS